MCCEDQKLNQKIFHTEEETEWRNISEVYFSFKDYNDGGSYKGQPGS